MYTIIRTLTQQITSHSYIARSCATADWPRTALCQSKSCQLCCTTVGTSCTTTHTHPFNGPFSGTTRVSRYQKGRLSWLMSAFERTLKIKIASRIVKPIWILLKQETVSGSGIRWAICKSAPRSRQITILAPHRSVFYRPDALPGASCTTSPQQIEAMELDGCDQTVDEFCWQHDRLAGAKFAKSGVWGQSSRGKCPYFWRCPNSLKLFRTSRGRRKLPYQNQLDSFSLFDRTLTCDRHRAMEYTCTVLAERCAVKTPHKIARQQAAINAVAEAISNVRILAVINPHPTH